jgi:enoyl-coA hydratase
LFLLTRALGVTRATQLAMTGEAFTAEKAFEAGAVYRVCTSDQLEKTRNQLLKKLKRGSSNSYAAIKKLVWESEFKQWQDYANLELELQKSLAYTEDFKEGVLAHSERRRPKFLGK